MVVAEVTRTEQERLNIKAVSQSRQGGWMSWEGVTDRHLSWPDLWKIPQARISFLIRSTYDTLPCPETSTSGSAQKNSAPFAVPTMQASSTSCRAARQHCPKAAIGGDMIWCEEASRGDRVM